MTKFGQVSEGRDNNFDFLRFFLATCVIFSHSFAVLYDGTWFAYDPLIHLSRGQAAFGGGAVDGFFLISGFLITKSWERSRGLGDYAKKRVLRIVPALVVVILLTVFVLGPIATALSLGSYFHSPRTYAYLGFMGTKNLHLTDRLPGVFEHNPLAFRVNGSLWTIRCEAICYVLVAILGLLQAYRRPVVVLIAAVATLPFLARHSGEAGGLGDWTGSFHVLAFFLWGMTFYLFRGKIPYSPALFGVALALLVATDLLHVLPGFLPWAFGYVLFYVAFSARLRLHHFARRGDFSYGIYLYAFPVQQALAEFFRQSLNAYTLFLATFAVSGLLAVLSWHFIEKPFLKRKASGVPLPDDSPSRIISPEPVPT